MTDLEDTAPLPLTPEPSAEASNAAESADTPAQKRPRLEPTRYGDWELNGKCVDF